MPQIVDQTDSGHRIALHRFGVVAEAVAPRPLGDVHRLIGVFEQVLAMAGVIGEEGNADAGRDVALLAVEIVGGTQGVQNRADNRFDMDGLTDIGQHHRELVPSEPGNDVPLAHTFSDSPRRLPKQQIPLAVPQGVVDLFEAIQVDKKHRQFVSPSPFLTELLVESIPEQTTVGQAGQAVIIGLAPDQVVHLFFLGDIREQSHMAKGGAVGVADQADRGPLGVERTILASIPDLPLPMPLVEDGVPHRAIEGFVVAPRREHLRILAHHLIEGVAGDLSESGIDVDDVVGRVGHQDCLAALPVDHRRQLQRFLGLLACGDVAGVAGGPQHLAPLIDDGGFEGLVPDRRSMLQHRLLDEVLIFVFNDLSIRLQKTVDSVGGPHLFGGTTEHLAELLLASRL